MSVMVRVRMRGRRGNGGGGVGCVSDEDETGDFDGFDEGGNRVLQLCYLNKVFQTGGRNWRLRLENGKGKGWEK